MAGTPHETCQLKNPSRKYEIKTSAFADVFLSCAYSAEAANEMSATFYSTYVKHNLNTERTDNPCHFTFHYKSSGSYAILTVTYERASVKRMLLKAVFDRMGMFENGEGDRDGYECICKQI